MNKEHPILFSTEMIHAILKGKKTQTRRLSNLKKVNENPDNWEPETREVPHPDRIQYGIYHYQNKKGNQRVAFRGKDERTEFVDCPYGKMGDVLWVRETWNSYNTASYGLPPKDVYLYKTAGTDRNSTWRPSIHMPKRAARIFLKVVSVKVQRLQDISNEDCLAEGIQTPLKEAYRSFVNLWEGINGKDSWLGNPWVWVIEFKRISYPGFG